MGPTLKTYIIYSSISKDKKQNNYQNIEHYN